MADEEAEAEAEAAMEEGGEAEAAARVLLARHCAALLGVCHMVLAAGAWRAGTAQAGAGAAAGGDPTLAPLPPAALARVRDVVYLQHLAARAVAPRARQSLQLTHGGAVGGGLEAGLPSTLCARALQSLLAEGARDGPSEAGGTGGVGGVGGEAAGGEAGATPMPAGGLGCSCCGSCGGRSSVHSAAVAPHRSYPA